MTEYNNVAMFDTRCWNGVVEGLKYTFKGWVREVVEDVITEKLIQANVENRTLTTAELCKRWDIKPRTLYNYEESGKISPLPIGGRKKIYSMQDVLKVEAEGLVKLAC